MSSSRKRSGLPSFIDVDARFRSTGASSVFVGADRGERVDQPDDGFLIASGSDRPSEIVSRSVGLRRRRRFVRL